MAGPWAESWRGKSASTCEPSPEFTFYSANLPPIEIRRNDGSCPRECFHRLHSPLHCTPGPVAGKKNTAWTGTKIRRKSPFSTWAFLARGARGGGSVNACITLRDSSFPCERWPNDRTDEENIARTGKCRDSSCKSDPSFHTPLRSFIC